MKSRRKRIKEAQKEAELAIKATNEKINELGASAIELDTVLNTVQEHFNKIKNVPAEQQERYKEAEAIRLSWKQQAEKIEKDYNGACAVTTGGVVGAGVGVAVATMGPTAAMGVATTFGVASTGTAISSLSGAAATNAALAWLGGGALASGGGGMVAGQALLALAGPVGWSVAGVALLASGIAFFVGVKDKRRLDDIYSLISKRDVNKYKLAVVEMNEKIQRMDNDRKVLNESLARIQTYGLDYSDMTEAQQYELGTLVNQVAASIELIVSQIKGLLPYYTEEDYDFFLSVMYSEGYPDNYARDKIIIVYLANLLYGIKMDIADRRVFSKAIKSNKKLLKSLGTTKKEFDVGYIDLALKALSFKYE